MSTYVEYQLDDDQTILVSLPEDFELGVAKAAADEDHIIIKSERRFSEALKSIRSQAKSLRSQLSDLQADEVTVKFGLTTTGEVGIFAVGKIGLGTNYEITLKWGNPSDKA